MKRKWIHSISDDALTYLHYRLSLLLPACCRSTPFCTLSPNHVWPSAVLRTAPTAPLLSTVTTVPSRPGSCTATPARMWRDTSSTVPLIIFYSTLLLWGAAEPEVSRFVQIRLKVEAGVHFSCSVVTLFVLSGVRSRSSLTSWSFDVYFCSR